MKSAKEMFEELGYVQTIDNNRIYYHKIITIPKKYGGAIIDSINFIPKNRYLNKNTIHTSKNINVEELQAINKQVEELGWTGSDKEC